MPPTFEDEDTIVVKGEDWHSSSPDSISPPIGPLVANIMAQINNTTSSPLASPSTLPDRQSSAIHVSQPPSAPQEQSTYHTPRKRAAQGTMEERLQAMPELRPMPWRPGTEVPDELETGGESRRKQIRFGCLLATRGDVQVEPCNTCRSGRGKFSVCVALEGFFKGACASCQLSGRPNRCTIKATDEPKPDSDMVQIPNTTNPHQGESHANGHYSDGVLPQSQLHNRVLAQVQKQPPSQYRKSYSHREHSTETPQAKRRRTDGPQWDKALGVSHVQQPVKEQAPPQWAAVNHPEPLARVKTNNGLEINGKVSQNNSDYERREDTATFDDSSGVLLDTLPKNKQRQIYSLVSGLQGGIEHLQKELDMLKRVLGIDDGV